MEDTLRPRLLYMMICEDANLFHTNDGTKIIIMQPIISLKRPLPDKIRFHVALGFRDLNSEEENILQLKIKSPSGVEKLMPPDPLNEPGKRKGRIKGNFGIDLGNIPIDVEGLYVVEAYLNNKLLGEQVFEVHRANAGEGDEQ
jgi:hypothetical protein